ncbi:hypothetical protein M5C99_17175 [Acidovorax sp. NCPPB 2350]|nr:hypothetical protein M5C99_17175 [Acidovorax sp. NCPPB 2350]
MVVGIARDGYLTPRYEFPDRTHIPAMSPPRYGQDITFGCRMAPGRQSVGNTPDELAPKMQKLLGIFAAGDRTGMAKRLFDAFLQPRRSTVEYFDDPNLNIAAASHPNIMAFCSAVLSAPGSQTQATKQTRLHQELKKAQWDIQKLYMPANLGVPAFNLGSKVFSTKDFNNGLGLMINGVQYVYVIATHYHYDSKAGKYWLTLKFVFYDVFGLDDDDLKEYGAASDNLLASSAAVGITAWWQLQHQYAYPPLVTRAVVIKDYEIHAG